MSWDTSVPAGSDFISLGDDVIRQMKADLQTALRGDETDGDVAKFPGADAANPIFAYRGRKDITGNRPAATDEGLFFDQTRNVLQRSNGTTYDDVGTVLPAGTALPFYQATVPVGWTAVALNDKFLRVVSSGGTGGSSGGSGLTPSSALTLAHTHTVANHAHDLGNHTHTSAAHTHTVPYNGWTNSAVGAANDVIQTGTAGNRNATADNTSGSTTPGVTGGPSTNTSGGTAPGTDSQLTTTAFQYADFVIGTKD